VSDRPPPHLDLEAFFAPRSVAVVGVSDRPQNLGSNIVANLASWGFAGAVYAVGRGGGRVHGLQVLPDVEQLPRGVDLACVLTPAATVPGIVEALGRRGVRAVCVESSGFGELDDSGLALSREVSRAIRRHDMRLIGPNCLGTFATDSRLCCSFAGIRPLRAGPVGLVSQSGGVLFSYLRDLDESCLGLSRAASIGNKLDVDEVDLIHHLDRHPQTRVICLHLEDIRRGRALMEAAAGCSKPIVLHKVNRSPLTRTIAASHTASLLADHAVVEAAARQAGMVAVEDTSAALLAANALLLPPLRGRRIAVVSRSGGHAVIAADACAARGFELPPLPGSLLDALRARLRAGVIRLGNPLDLGDLWDIDAYRAILEQIAALELVDGIVFVAVQISAVDPAVHRRIATHVAEVSRNAQKPIALCYMSWRETARQLGQEVDWPQFAFVEDAVSALALLRDHHLRQSPPRPSPPEVARRTTGGAEPMALEDCLSLLRRFELPLAESRVAEDPERAARAARTVGFPVVVKLLSPEVVHKSDVGGVALGLKSAAQVRRACHGMAEQIAARRPEARISGYLVQAQADPGLELIVGFRRDPVFGPAVLVGLGGTLVEVLRDVALRVAPVTADDARSMLSELSGAPRLEGARGAAPLDTPALCRLIERFSRLALEEQETLLELEINPVILYPEGRGCVIVDVRGFVTNEEPG
jgi:acyl-CoA synthetase (NDP forming)